MTQKAKRLIEESRNAIVSTEEQLLLHPYPEALEKKGLGKGKLTMFAVQQYYVMEYNVKAVECAHERASSPIASNFMLEMVNKVRAASDALELFSKSLGLSKETICAGEPLSGAIAYSMYTHWLASNGSTAELAAAFLGNMPLWGANCARMSRALQANYDLKKEDVAFFDMFTAASPEFERMGLEVVEDGLDHGVDPVLIRRSVRLLQRYELMFWETMWERSRS